MTTYCHLTFLVRPCRDEKYCDQRVKISVCLSVFLCPLAYLKKQVSKFSVHVISVAVACSSSDGIEVLYLLPVLWMTSYVYKMERIGQNQRPRMIRPVRQVAAPGRSLPSPTASC